MCAPFNRPRTLPQGERASPLNAPNFKKFQARPLPTTRLASSSPGSPKVAPTRPYSLLRLVLAAGFARSGRLALTARLTFPFRGGPRGCRYALAFAVTTPRARCHLKNLLGGFEVLPATHPAVTFGVFMAFFGLFPRINNPTHRVDMPFLGAFVRFLVEALTRPEAHSGQHSRFRFLRTIGVLLDIYARFWVSFIDLLLNTLPIGTPRQLNEATSSVLPAVTGSHVTVTDPVAVCAVRNRFLLRPMLVGSAVQICFFGVPRKIAELRF